MKARDFSPSIYYKGSEPKIFQRFLFLIFVCTEKKEFSSISQLLETYYSEKNNLTRIRQKSVDLRRVVQTALERNRKKYDLQFKQIRDTENREKYKVYGGIDPYLRI